MNDDADEDGDEYDHQVYLLTTVHVTKKLI